MATLSIFFFHYPKSERMWRRLPENGQKAISLIYLRSCLALRSKTFPTKNKTESESSSVCARNLNNRSIECQAMRNRKKSNNITNRKYHPPRPLCGCATIWWGDREQTTDSKPKRTHANKQVDTRGSFKMAFIGLQNQNENILRMFI